MAMKTGAISGTVARMVGDGALSADGEPGKRDTLYSITEIARALLESDAGTPSPDQEMRHVVVTARGAPVGQVARLIGQRPDALHGLVWATRLDGAGWMFAFRPDVLRVEIDRFVARLETVGATCATEQEIDRMSRSELLRHCSAVLDPAE
jgi:hypothetical protein